MGNRPDWALGVVHRHRRGRRKAIAGLLVLGACVLLVAGCGRAPGPAGPTRPQAILAEARAAVANGDVLTAAPLYRRAAERTRNFQDAGAIREELAMTLLSAAAAADSPAAVRSQAVKAAEEAMLASPESTAIRLALGRQLVASGQFAPAREHLTRGLEGLDVDSTERIAAKILLARAWEGTGHRDEAIAIVAPIVGYDSVSKRIEGDAGSPQGVRTTEAFVVLGRILRGDRDDPAAADDVMSHCAPRNPDDPVAWTETAKWRDSLGDAKGARHAVEQAVRLAPADPTVLRAEVDRALKDADRERAASALARLREVSPRAPETFQLAARFLTTHGTATEAIDFIADWLGNLGRRPERQVLQVAKLAIAVRLTPADTPALSERLVAIRDRLGPLLPFAQILEGRALMQDRRWHAAAKRLMDARALTPQPARNSLCLLLARCHEQLGSFDEQLADCRQVDRSIDAAQALRADSIALAALARLGRRGTLRSDSSLLLHAINGNTKLSQADVDGAISSLVAAQIEMAPDQRNWDALDDLVERRLASPDEATDRQVVLRAVMLEAKGEIEAAIESLRRTAGTAAESADVRVARIRMTARHRGVDEALRFESEQTMRKDDTPAILVASVTAVAADSPRGETDWIDAYTRRAAAIKVDADEGEALIAIAALAIRTDAWDRARAALLAASALMPDDPRAPLALARAAAARGDAATATEAAADVLGIDGPSAPTTRLAAAAVLIAKAIADPAHAIGPLGEGRALLVEAAADRPGWIAIQTLQAEIETLARDRAAAIRFLEEARRLGPYDGDLDRRLVGLLVEEGRFAEAERIRGSVAPPSFPGGIRTAIDRDLRAGFTEATIDRILRTCPPADADEFVWFARLLAKEGRTAESVECLEKAVTIAPDQPDGWLWLVASHVAAGDREIAERILERAVSATPEDARLLLAARGAAVLGRLEDAARDYRLATARCEGWTDPPAHAVDFFLRQGRPDEAVTLLHGLIDTAAGKPGWGRAENWAVGRLQTVGRPRSSTKGKP